MSERSRFYVDTKVEEVAPTNLFTSFMEQYIGVRSPAQRQATAARIQALLSTAATKRAGDAMMAELAKQEVDFYKMAAELRGKEVSAKPLRDQNFTSFLNTMAKYETDFASLNQDAKANTLEAQVAERRNQTDVVVEGVKGGNLNTPAWAEIEADWKTQIGDMSRAKEWNSATASIWKGKLDEVAKKINASSLSPEQKRTAVDRARGMVEQSALPEATKAELVTVANGMLPSRPISDALPEAKLGMSGPGKGAGDATAFLNRATDAYVSSGAAERSGVPAGAPGGGDLGAMLAEDRNVQPLINELLDAARARAKERQKLADEAAKPVDPFMGLGNFNERLGGKGGAGEFIFDPVTGQWDSAIEAEQKRRKAERKQKRASAFELKATP